MRDPSCVRAGGRGVWEWGVGLKKELTKELTKEKIKDRLKVTRARDRSVDTAAFTFLREHVKGSRARLERVRTAAKQSISALRLQSLHTCVWAAELEQLAREHWRGGVVVSAVERIVSALQSAEKQRVLLLVSAQQRLLEIVEGLLVRYDDAREDKLRLYWARCAVEEASDKVKHYRRKITDGKPKQESKMQAALNEVLMTQRTYQHLNETLAQKMVELEASAAVAMLNASAGYMVTHCQALESAVGRLDVLVAPLLDASLLLERAAPRDEGHVKVGLEGAHVSSSSCDMYPPPHVKVGLEGAHSGSFTSHFSQLSAATAIRDFERWREAEQSRTNSEHPPTNLEHTNSEHSSRAHVTDEVTGGREDNFNSSNNSHINNSLHNNSHNNNRCYWVCC